MTKIAQRVLRRYCPCYVMRVLLIAIVGGILGAPPVLSARRRSCADGAGAKHDPGDTADC